MRREAAPAGGAGETKLVQNFGVVISDAAREDLPLPGIRRRFESLQLTQRFQRSALTQKLRTRRDMLPAKQPAHKLRGRNGFNLFSKLPQRQAMDAGEEAAFAPFGLRLRIGLRVGLGLIRLRWSVRIDLLVGGGGEFSAKD